MAAATRAHREAERWHARLAGPDCSERDRAAFERWHRESPAHAEAYAATERLLTRVDELAEHEPRMQVLLQEARQPADSALKRPASVPSEVGRTETPVVPGFGVGEAGGRSMPKTFPGRLRWVLAGGAAAAAAIAVTVGLLDFGPEPVHYAATAERRTVELADGSHVDLDVASRISTRFTADRRDVELEAGRALFEVTPERTRPFIVRSGGGSITALGTRFQVEREDDRVTVTLAEGSVVVRHEAAEGPTPRSLRLQPGEQLIYSDDASIWQRRPADVIAATSWSRGRLVFRNTPLAQVVAEVNRYSRRKIVLADTSLADLPVHGNFLAGDAKQVVAALEAVLPLRVDERASEILLHRSPESR